VFKQFPEKEGLFEELADLLSGSTAGIRATEGLSTLMRSPAVSTLATALEQTPRGQVELRATNLPVQ
jgi:hypothetical protein